MANKACIMNTHFNHSQKRMLAGTLIRLNIVCTTYSYKQILMNKNFNPLDFEIFDHKIEKSFELVTEQSPLTPHSTHIIANINII